MYRAKIPPPPRGVDGPTANWMNSVVDAINALPTVSFISTSDGPVSAGLTALSITLAFDVGSSTTKLWLAPSPGSSWSAISVL